MGGMDSSTSIRILVGPLLASILSACGGSASALETDVETSTVRQRSELTAVTKAYGESDEQAPSDDVVISGNEGDLIEVITSTSGGSTGTTGNSPLTHNALAVPGLLGPPSDDVPEGSVVDVLPADGVVVSVP